MSYKQPKIFPFTDPQNHYCWHSGNLPGDVPPSVPRNTSPLDVGGGSPDWLDTGVSSPRQERQQDLTLGEILKWSCCCWMLTNLRSKCITLIIIIDIRCFSSFGHVLIAVRTKNWARKNFCLPSSTCSQNSKTIGYLYLLTRNACFAGYWMLCYCITKAEGRDNLW